MQRRASEELRRCKSCASRGGASSRGRDDEGAGGATERVTGPITLSEILLLEKVVGILGDDEYLLGDLSTVSRWALLTSAPDLDTSPVPHVPLAAPAPAQASRRCTLKQPRQVRPTSALHVGVAREAATACDGRRGAVAQGSAQRRDCSSASVRREASRYGRSCVSRPPRHPRQPRCAGRQQARRGGGQAGLASGAGARDAGIIGGTDAVTGGSTAASRRGWGLASWSPGVRPWRRAAA